MPPKPPSNRGPVLALLTEGPYRWLLLSSLFSSVGVELRVMAQSWLILELVEPNTMWVQRRDIEWFRRLSYHWRNQCTGA